MANIHPTKDHIWFELEQPRDDKHAQVICDKANRLMKRLRREGDSVSACFEWDSEARMYTYGSPMGYKFLTDRGNWFNLDYLGRDDEHDLYTDADADRPDVICDGNGSVTLALCKRCGMGESQLTNNPKCPGYKVWSNAKVNKS